MSGSPPGTPRVLRAMNDRTALQLLLEQGPLSRARIGRLTGLSKPTASQLLARLEAAGLVLATGTSQGRPGPNAQLYALNPASAHVGALDVTTDGIRAAVATLTGETIGHHHLPTPRTGSPVELVPRALGAAAREAGLRTEELHRVVIGTPGAFDPSTGRLRYASHLPGWHSPRLLEDLARALPVPLEYDNDVNLVAVAERTVGAARGRSDLVLLWLDRGIGAALVLGGRIHRGATGGAGELGFLPVPGTPLVRHAARYGSGGFQELAGPHAVLRLGEELGLPAPEPSEPAEGAAELLRAASRSRGTGVHGELLRRFAAGTAVGLASVVTVVDPGLVVLSGRLSLAGGEVFRELVQGELADLVVPRPELVTGWITETPVLRGALESALESTRNEVFDTLR
ncbi:ROK family transcriptional regulator [Streptomyces sp. NPDC005438]|uniref:ROK family transcriptional regulator n=1 Tax=Streptomyces sp. NPDC005438 TaxID=3156880 RepID=UPI00339EBDE0